MPPTPSELALARSLAAARPRSVCCPRCGGAVAVRDAARRRRGAVTPRHCVPSVASRGVVWCGRMLSAAGGSAHEASLPEPIGSKPTASLRLRRRLRLLPPLRGCGRGDRVVCSVPCSGADFVVTVVTAFLPRFAGVADRGLLVLVVPAGAASRHRRSLRSSPVAALPLVPFGHSQHVAASLTITRSPHRTARYRYAFGAESFRRLASLRSADLRS